MRSVHYITIAVAVALIFALYTWGNTIPPVKEKTGQPMAGMPPRSASVQAASFDSILAASKARLSADAAEKIKAIENQLTANRDSSGMAVIFYQLAHLWDENKMPPVAAYYGAKAAKLENSEKKLNFAGQFFMDLMNDTSMSESVRLWEAKEAVDCFTRSKEINPGNDTTKLKLATAYIEGTNETMQGVQLLLAMTRENPDNLPANLMLGKLAIRSGQFDKAIKRLETLLGKYPDNSEVMYFLAEAYKGKGDKAKAIEIFEKCKQIVNKPEFSRDIDAYINSFK